MDVSLLDQIKIAQHEKGQPLLILIEKFTPLIKSYSRTLNYEDAENDMVIDFIILVMGFDVLKFESQKEGCILGYIKKSMYHSNIRRSIKNCSLLKSVSVSNLVDGEQWQFENRSTNDDLFDNLFTSEVKRLLTKQEFCILYQYVFLERPIIQIASDLRISRQAANQCKKRALKKLEVFIRGYTEWI